MLRQPSTKFSHFIIFFALFLGIFSVSGLAQSSANFVLGGSFENGGGQNISGNFVQNCNQISGGIIGQGASSSYSISSSVPCESSQVTFNIRVAPEKRIPINGLNLFENTVIVKIFSVGGSSLLYQTPAPLSLDQDGYSATTITAPLASGNYDIIVKTNQHLSKKYTNILIPPGLNTLDLTNSLANFLKAGDVNITENLGDNTINALDISKEINQLDTSSLQPDLNRDTKVNALDIGILLKNLGQSGD
jgi:hypothetical protein